MYEIRPETVKSFITDRNVRLPRFQRKQTWDPKKNFQLCISLFKEYPIGVCILSVDEFKGKTVRWLLDGRQRKNALTKMYEDPENIYNWARAFIGFKNSDQPFELEEKYWEKINEYIEADVDEEYGNTSEGEDDSLPAESEEDVVIRDSSSGLELLLDIIKIIHNKQKKNTGFTKPFDFTKYVDRLPYMENGENALSSRKLKMFIDEYRNHADAYRQDYEDEDCFYEYLDSRSIVKDEKKTKQLIHDKWDEILERMLIIDKIDSQLTSSKIGMIEVKNLSPSDSQKIFNIINSEGEKLKAVEILSAKPHWNIPIINPSQEAIDAVKELYKELETVPSDVVRWDYPATILRRLGTNCVIKQFAPTKTDFVKELTCGFKIVAGIYEGGVKKESIEKLSKSTALNWNKDFDQLIYDLNGKRIQELQLLKRMLTYSHGFPKLGLFAELSKDMKSYGKELNQDQKENIVNVMTNEFPAGTGKKTYSQCVFIEEAGNDYKPTKSFVEMLSNDDFYNILKELVDFGISRYERDYRNSYAKTDLVLYQKYTYEDVCRLLNWAQNEVPLNIGGYKFDKKTKTFPVFINYDKEENISDTTKYEDHFIPGFRDRLIAISKSGRSLQSEDVQNFLKAKERGIQVELFVRKNKDDKISKEFYYLGHMTASGKTKEFKMANTEKTAVEIEWILDVPVREDIYEYIVNS